VLGVTDSNLSVSHDGSLTDADRALIRTRKSDLVALLVATGRAVAVRGPTPWPPRPAELARWPLEWRQRWGLLANKLEDQGLKFPECERRAFDQIKAEKEASR
jgi:hypothetical protein